MNGMLTDLNCSSEDEFPDGSRPFYTHTHSPNTTMATPGASIYLGNHRFSDESPHFQLDPLSGLYKFVFWLKFWGQLHVPRRV